MTMRKTISGIACLTALANCGSSSDQMAMGQMPPALPVLSINASDNGSLTVGGTPANPTFSINGTEITGLAENDLVNNGPLASSLFTFRDVAFTHHFLGARTNGGYVALGASEFTPVGSEYTAATLNRTSETVLPTTGTALYQGDYAGLVSERLAAGATNFNDVDYLVTGDVELNVNFNAAILSGAITNREVSAPANGTTVLGVSTDDVTLVASPINTNGVFAGVASGGDINSSGGTNGTGAGSYTGLFVGPTGDAALGVVKLPINTGSTYPTDGALELGAFVADKQ